MCECWVPLALCQGEVWCLLKQRDVKLGEDCSDGCLWVSLKQPVPLSCAHLASCSLELWFWLSSKEPSESLQWEPLSTHCPVLFPLWVWCICLWPGKALAQSSDQAKLFVSLFICLLTLTHGWGSLKASLTESPLTQANS